MPTAFFNDDDKDWTALAAKSLVGLSTAPITSSQTSQYSYTAQQLSRLTAATAAPAVPAESFAIRITNERGALRDYDPANPKDAGRKLAELKQERPLNIKFGDPHRSR